MPHGQIKACVRCGYCCRKAMCFFGKTRAVLDGIIENVWDFLEECPYLYEVGDGTFGCSLVKDFYSEIGIGDGCCSPAFNTDREAILRRLGVDDAYVQDGRYVERVG